MKKTKLIKRWIALLVVSALSFVEKKFISKIPIDWVRKDMELLIEPLKLTALAISDSNPNNSEQIEAIWRKAISGKFIDFNQMQVMQKIEESIKKENIKRALLTLVIPTFGMVRDLLDDNPADGKQIEERWLQFIQDPNVQEVVLSELLTPALLRYVNDQDTVDFIIDIIRQALASGNSNELAPEQITRVLSMLPPAAAA